MSFAFWSLIWLNLEHKFKCDPSRQRKTEILRELYTICSSGSALARLIRCGANGKLIPRQLTLSILVRLASDLKADVSLKSTLPNGQFRECLIVRSGTLLAQLAEAFPQNGLSRLVITQADDLVQDFHFERLFELASSQGYRLTVRLLFNDQVVPSAAFDQTYPILRTHYEEWIRSQRRPP
ncbi:MAG TPA: hypothetical protein V6C81_27310 [Planktothrix sp.]